MEDSHLERAHCFIYKSVGSSKHLEDKDDPKAAGKSSPIQDTMSLSCFGSCIQEYYILRAHSAHPVGSIKRNINLNFGNTMQIQAPILLFFHANLLIAPFRAVPFSGFSGVASPLLDNRSTRTTFFFPLQQQTPQQVPTWSMKPRRLKPEAIHMNASIGVPSSALIFNSGADSKTFWKMMNMTVATTLAPAVRIRVMKVKITRGISRSKILRRRCDHRGLRLKPSGARKMARNVRTLPARKQPNIQ